MWTTFQQAVEIFAINKAMLKKLAFAVFAFLLPLISCPARADYVRGSQSMVIFGGQGGSASQYDYHPGNQKTITGGGGAFGAQYLYYVAGTPALAVGADITSSLNGNGHSDHLLDGIDTTSRIKSLVGLVMARLAYPRGPYRPYIFAGVGAHDSSQQLFWPTGAWGHMGQWRHRQPYPYR